MKRKWWRHTDFDFKFVEKESFRGSEGVSSCVEAWEDLGNVFDTDLAGILGGATDGGGKTVKRRERKTVKTREGDLKFVSLQRRQESGLGIWCVDWRVKGHEDRTKGEEL